MSESAERCAKPGCGKTIDAMVHWLCIKRLRTGECRDPRHVVDHTFVHPAPSPAAQASEPFPTQRNVDLLLKHPSPRHEPADSRTTGEPPDGFGTFPETIAPVSLRKKASERLCGVPDCDHGLGAHFATTEGPLCAMCFPYYSRRQWQHKFAAKEQK